VRAHVIAMSFFFAYSVPPEMWRRIYILCVLIMMIMALLASTLPASRAASANPMDGLRSS